MKNTMLSELSLLNDIFDEKGKYVTFFGSARLSADDFYCQKAYELSKKLVAKDFIVVTGGGDGIMQAANKAAFEVGKSIGINIILPHEQASNPYINKGALISNLSLRKTALIEHSRAFVVFPGGFGTLDELFEILCLVQTRLRKSSQIYLFGSKFWEKLDDFMKTTLVKTKTISPNDIGLYTLSDDIDEIYASILAH